MSALKDLTGQRFGRLVVIEREGSTPLGLATWQCLCDCGNRCVVDGSKLRSGHTKSCRCLSVSLSRRRSITHGKSKTRLWNVWSSMKQRCYSSSHKDYKRYGGRGITVCNEWRHNFDAFRNWAVANGYDENAPFGQCTIDRIDNDKGYSPDNCRWADQKTQQNNRSNNRKVVNQ